MWGIFNTYGVFFIPLQDEFMWSRAEISGARSLSMFVWGFLGILLGNLNDRYGPRVIMAVCGCFFGVGYFLMSQVNSIWQLYLFHGLIVGIGVSATDVVILSTVARWFVQRRGMMTGIIKAGTGLGMFIMPLVATVFISSYSWRISYMILGVLGFILIISLAQLLRRDPAHVKQVPDKETRVKFADLKSAELGLSFHDSTRTKQLWITSILYFAIWFCVNIVLVHITPYAIDIGISPTKAAVVLSSIGAISILGRLVLGSMSDRIGCTRSITICCVTFVLSFILLLIAKSFWMLILFALIYGIAHGGFATLISPLVGELFGLRSHGVILGLIICIGTVGGAISPIFAGYMFDTTESYQVAFIICLLMGVTGLMFSVTLKPVVSAGSFK
jgi:MFS family permease